jgi:hypothetical protein
MASVLMPRKLVDEAAGVQDNGRAAALGDAPTFSNNPREKRAVGEAPNAG